METHGRVDEIDILADIFDQNNTGEDEQTDERRIALNSEARSHSEKRISQQRPPESKLDITERSEKRRKIDSSSSEKNDNPYSTLEPSVSAPQTSSHLVVDPLPPRHLIDARYWRSEKDGERPALMLDQPGGYTLPRRAGESSHSPRYQDSIPEGPLQETSQPTETSPSLGCTVEKEVHGNSMIFNREDRSVNRDPSGRQFDQNYMDVDLNVAVKETQSNEKDLMSNRTSLGHPHADRDSQKITTTNDSHSSKVKALVASLGTQYGKEDDPLSPPKSEKDAFSGPSSSRVLSQSSSDTGLRQLRDLRAEDGLRSDTVQKNNWNGTEAVRGLKRSRDSYSGDDQTDRFERANSGYAEMITNVGGAADVETPWARMSNLCPNFGVKWLKVGKVRFSLSVGELITVDNGEYALIQEYPLERLASSTLQSLEETSDASPVEIEFLDPNPDLLMGLGGCKANALHCPDHCSEIMPATLIFNPCGTDPLKVITQDHNFITVHQSIYPVPVIPLSIQLNILSANVKSFHSKIEDSSMSIVSSLPLVSPPARHDIWSGFYKKGLRERQHQLKLAFPNLFSQVDTNGTEEDSGDMFPINGLDEDVANNMIENCIGTIGLPVGLALNFTINEESYVIPMAVEEPSVIAAVSGAAKTISQYADKGMFIASSSERNVVFAQVQLLDIPPSDVQCAMEKLEARKDHLKVISNSFCPSMYSRGGGVIELTFRRVVRNPPRTFSPQQINLCGSFDWVVVHLHIDVKDAMGANVASQVAEGVAPILAEISGGRIVKKLKYKGLPGEELAQRIVDAYQWAEADPFRATTHNKGIMNGVDAVAVALGQDWRALEAAAHVHACGKNHNNYGSLTKYWIEESPPTLDGDQPTQISERYLCGTLELLVPCGTKGGVLQTHPVYNYTMGLCGNPDSRKLGHMLASVGLAQNFAALRALCSEGISKGHMNLHARNIAIAAGASMNVVGEVTTWMISSGRITLKAAQEYLIAHRLHNAIQTSRRANLHHPEMPPSMFYFAESTKDSLPSAPGFEETVTLNVAFQTLEKEPTSLEITDNGEVNAVTEDLFGEKTSNWIATTMQVISGCQLIPKKSARRSNVSFVRRLKYITLLMNLLLRQLSSKFPAQTRLFIEAVLSHARASILAPRTPEISVPSTRQRSGSVVYMTPPGALSEEGKATVVARIRRSSINYLSLAAVARGSSKGVIETILDSTVEASRALDLGLVNEEKQSTSVELTDTSNTQSSGSAGTWEENVEWTLPEESGLFKEDVLAQIFELEPELGTNIRAAKIGFPLLLALWQVFELRVAQSVTNPRLCSMLVEEQRRSVCSIASLPPPEDLDPQEILYIYAKRLPVKLFVLLDAVTFDLSEINDQRLSEIDSLGFLVEWHMMRIHDVSRAERDRRALPSTLAKSDLHARLAMGNAFYSWLNHRYDGRGPGGDEELVRMKKEFLNATEKNPNRRLQADLAYWEASKVVIDKWYNIQL
ncbi:hypothetical protein HDU93_007908 [Gonapodya sp. JEL0774]|nr:hypothetical protein HDU93_007908 [Gonapodya sp. JEL0774]